MSSISLANAAADDIFLSCRCHALKPLLRVCAFCNALEPTLRSIVYSTISRKTFIMKLRIQAACEALQHKDAEIQEVARAHGFCSQSAFTQLFQKYVGLTPLKYQKRFELKQTDRRKA